MPNNASISIAKLSSAVTAAVSANADLAKLDLKPTIHFGPGIIGFIIRDYDKVKLPELEAIAGALTKDVGAGIAARSGAAVVDGSIVVGFWPGPDYLNLVK